MVAKDGVVFYNKSFGKFTYKGTHQVADSDLYDLASMTKASATLPAVMKLYDEKKIRLNTPVSNFIHAFKGTNKSAITIKETLFHESGLPPFIPYYIDAIDFSSFSGKLFSRVPSSEFLANLDRHLWARTDFKYKPNIVSSSLKPGFLPLADSLYVNKSYSDTIIENIARVRLHRKNRYLYSCLNFILLDKVIENIVHEDLNGYLQREFYHKLGAYHTTYNPLLQFPKGCIAPTEQDDFLRRQLLQGYVEDEAAAFMGGISGNAGLFSNANDLAKLFQLWLNGGVYGGERYLSKQTTRLFTSMKSAHSRRGLGFDKPEPQVNKPSPCSPSTPVCVYGHTGFTGTCFWIDPRNKLIYIFLSNRIYSKRTHENLILLAIRQRIQEQLYNALKPEKLHNQKYKFIKEDRKWKELK